jgi:hypothetical protein
MAPINKTRQKIQDADLIGTVRIAGVAMTKTAAQLNAGATGTQVAAITDASTVHALNATFSDTEVETALNALGTKINLIIAALEAYGIAAS